MIPDGLTFEFLVDVNFQVDAKVTCTKCGKKRVTIRPFTFKRTIEVPYTIKGIKLIAKIVGMVTPGLQVLSWAHTAIEIYGTISDAKSIVANIQSGWDTGQALSRCTGSKRALSGIAEEEEVEDMDDDDVVEEIEAEEELALSPEVVEVISKKLEPPKNWQSLYTDTDPNSDPPGMCPIYTNPTELRGKYCVCHNAKGEKEENDCSVFDALPQKARENIVWANAKCLPFNCKPVAKNGTVVPVIIKTTLDDISDETTESFMEQIESKVGSESVTLVGIATGNGTSSGTTELQVQLPDPKLHSLDSVHSLSAADGRVFPVSIGHGSSSTMSWFYIGLSCVVILALLILIFVVVMFFKGFMREKEEKKHEGDETRYTHA
jgi:hypothetical protein